MDAPPRGVPRRADWSALLAFGPARSSGHIPIRLGERYLLVTWTVASALWHLHLSKEPLTRDETSARLREVLPPSAAQNLGQKLWPLFEGPSVTQKKWHRRILRIPLAGRSVSLLSSLRARLFSLPVIALWLLAALSAVGSFAVWGHRPSLALLQHLHLSDLAMAWAMQLIVIAVHESGHLLAAAHFGVPVREVGIALHYLQPAVYTDVSDAWLASRRARIVIAAEGVHFHTVPVFLFCILWQITGNGLWFLLFVANVFLILVNLLPVIRLDGYWMLANWLEEPNLQQRADNQLTHSLVGKPEFAEWTGARGVLMNAYSLASLMLPAAFCLAFAWLFAALFPQAPRVILFLAASTLAIVQSALGLRTLLRATRDPGPRPATRDPEPQARPATIEGNTLFINPFRFRGQLADSLVLGGLAEMKLLPPKTPLAFLARNQSIRSDELRLLDPNARDWILKERYLLESPPDTQGRWSRQTGFFSFWPGDPEARQAQLERATVCILGLGTLGSQVAYLLAAAGIGRMTVCDFDVVELSNLNRQILFRESDVGEPKARVAVQRLRGVNSRIAVRGLQQKLSSVAEIEQAIAAADIVIRAIDTPPRISLKVDQACRLLKIPHVGGGFVEHSAIAGPFVSPEGPCLACLTGSDDVSPAFYRAPSVTGPCSFWVSSYIAGDALRVLAALGAPSLLNRAVVFDGRTGEVSSSVLQPGRKECSVCGGGSSPGSVTDVP